MVFTRMFCVCFICVVFTAFGAHASEKSKRHWGPEQATGAPDTPRAGDIATAWATLRTDGGIEWLHVEFEKSVYVAEVRIRETYNPGAVIKVTAFDKRGKERLMWSGQDSTTKAPADFVVKPKNKVKSKSIKIYLDTRLKSGWNEIDAVALVGKDGSLQWASKATASSTFAEQRHSGVVHHFPQDPFAALFNKTVTVRLEEKIELQGRLVGSKAGFIVLQHHEKTVMINAQRIIYIEELK